MRRNPAGDLIGPERECFRGDGRPKKVFASQEEAQAWLDERGMHQHTPYTCSKGHAHVGNGLRRPIIVPAEATARE
jgi:hypothetical protein